jgi:hypothetical protein
MITKKELMELLRSEDGTSEIADSILAKINQQPEGSAPPQAPEARSAGPERKDNPRPPSTGHFTDFNAVGRKLDAFAERLGVKPRRPNQSSTWAIRFGRNGNSYDVLELASNLLDRVEALDAKLDRKSWDTVISVGGDED